MVNDMTKFHKCHMGVGVCLNMCVQGYRILSFGRGVTPKFGVDVEEVFST